MRAWMLALALLAAVAACGRYGPPVRSVDPAPAPGPVEMSDDPNRESAPESQP